MTYPPGNQPPAQGGGQQPPQQTYMGGSIVEIEYKPPEDEQKKEPKKKRRGLKIFIFFAVMMLLIIIVMGTLALYILWPNEQVLELENVSITSYHDALGRRHWDITGSVKNIGSEPLEPSKIEIKISGAVVVEDVRESMIYFCTSNEVRAGVKEKLEPEESIGFRITEGLVEESTQTTRPQITIRLYYDGDEMDSTVEDVGGQW